jgi:hypothetical protein
MDDVNRQHIAAAGLDPDSLGRSVPGGDNDRGRCEATHPTQSWYRCQRALGHDGDHSRTSKRKPTADPLVWSDQDQPAPAPEPTKQRPGDQRLPDTRDGQVCVQDLVIAEMEESKRVGTERYGQPLMTFNGRRTIQDVREEARDLLVYLTQVTAEVEATRETLVTLAASVVDEKFGALFQGQTRENVAQDVAEAVVDRLLGHFTQPPAPDREEAIQRIVHGFARMAGTNFDEVRLDWQGVYREQAETAYDAIFGA